jgi:hypothetical protein
LLAIPVLIFDKKCRCFVDEISALWQHCLAGHIVFIGNPLQLEKKYTAKSKIDAAKSKNTCSSANLFLIVACTFK